MHALLAPHSSSLASVKVAPREDGGANAELQPYEPQPYLESLQHQELRAAMALASGNRAVAARIVRRAHRRIDLSIVADPEPLAQAVSSAVERVLQARRKLPCAIAYLVALLC